MHAHHVNPGKFAVHLVYVSRQAAYTKEKGKQYIKNISRNDIRTENKTNKIKTEIIRRHQRNTIMNFWALTATHIQPGIAATIVLRRLDVTSL